MENFIRPKIVISKCINLAKTRYDGGIIKDEFAEKLSKFVDYTPVCPEVEIGLGIPRDPIIIVKSEKDKLLQQNTQRDLTNDMENFSVRFLTNLTDSVDGFLLKAKSPSCGINDVNYYSNLETLNIIGKTSGMFARNVKLLFPYFPIESEKRLIDKGIRDLFLTKIFAFAHLRQLKEDLSKEKILEFHSEYKLMLITYNQSNLKLLGKLLSNLNTLPLEQVYIIYADLFRKSFSKNASKGNNVNTLLHAFGYFKDGLSSNEKAHFLDLVQEYLEGRVDKFTLIEILRNFTIRFNEKYLLKQRYLNPYPKELRFV
ncbi:MAG: DUF523 and DUF1722 domain-containing protein [Caldisericaceae bacterium]